MASKETRRGVEEEDLANVEFETSEDVEVIPTFDSMALREDLLRWEYKRRHYKERLFLYQVIFRGIYAYGFEKPSAIQQRAIKPIIKGRDVIAQAQSGTGKTATFSISILQVFIKFHTKYVIIVCVIKTDLIITLCSRSTRLWGRPRCSAWAPPGSWPSKSRR